MQAVVSHLDALSSRRQDIGLKGEALEALTGLEEEKAIQFWVCHGVLLRTRYVLVLVPAQGPNGSLEVTISAS